MDDGYLEHLEQLRGERKKRKAEDDARRAMIRDSSHGSGFVNGTTHGDLLQGFAEKLEAGNNKLAPLSPGTLDRKGLLGARDMEDIGLHNLHSYDT